MTCSAPVMTSAIEVDPMGGQLVEKREIEIPNWLVGLVGLLIAAVVFFAIIDQHKDPSRGSGSTTGEAPQEFEGADECDERFGAGSSRCVAAAENELAAAEHGSLRAAREAEHIEQVEDERQEVEEVLRQRQAERAADAVEALAGR